MRRTRLFRGGPSAATATPPLQHPRSAPSQAPSPTTSTSAAAPPEIVAEQLGISFGDHAVLRGVDLTIRQGEMVAVVGGSGSGKTVLLKLITGHLRADAGRVMVADHESAEKPAPLRDLATLSDEQMDRLRIHWAVVFQRNALLSGTVLENLSLWPREVKEMGEEEILPLALKSLRAVGLDPDQVLSSQRETLSGGMAKRLAIARALMMDPVLIFYDEPTAGLDPEMSAHIHKLIQSTHADRPGLGVPRTSVIITHDTELLRRVRPRIVMLYEGRVYFDGSFDRFVSSTDAPIRPYLQQMPQLHAQDRIDLGEHSQLERS